MDGPQTGTALTEERDATQVGLIPAGAGAISDNLNLLEAELARLEDHLGPATNPNAVMSGGTISDDQVSPSVSPLAEDLSRSAARVGSLCERIARLRDRVDL